MFSESFLGSLQKSTSGKITSCNLRDANIDEYFHLRLKFKRKELPVEVLANDRAVCIRVKVDLPIRQLSVNRREATGFVSIPAGMVSVDSRSIPVFTSDGELSDSESAVLRSRSFLDLIVQTRLEEVESLHFYKNGIRSYLFEPTPKRVLTALEHLTDLACELSSPVETSTVDLPTQFRPLIPLIEKWAIHDDVEREERLKHTSRVELRRLVEEIRPYLVAIDSYLDSFSKSAPTESAAALGRLAECALEAEAELRNRV